jgi:hypothetical protein
MTGNQSTSSSRYETDTESEATLDDANTLLLQTMFQKVTALENQAALLAKKEQEGATKMMALAQENTALKKQQAADRKKQDADRKAKDALAKKVKVLEKRQQPSGGNMSGGMFGGGGDIGGSFGNF